LTPLLDVVDIGMSKATLPTQKMAARKVVILSSLSCSSALGIDDFSCNNKKCNKQTASTLFNVVGLGTQLGLFPPKKWHHFLGGKSCSQAPRPTTLKRVDAVCLLHSLLLQEKSSMPRADEPERDYYFARHCG